MRCNRNIYFLQKAVLFLGNPDYCTGELATATLVCCSTTLDVVTLDCLIHNRDKEQ